MRSKAYNTIVETQNEQILELVLKEALELDKRVASKLVPTPKGEIIDVFSKSQLRVVTSRRHLVFYALRSKGFKFKEIAQAFDVRHSTVMYGVDKVVATLKNDRAFRLKLKELIAREQIS
jgi:chromosomal replication initiation ATPase DnaA